jgi:multidrug transporter EmrE-like cation transporter
MNYIIILTSVFLNAFAQIALKKGMMVIGRFDFLQTNYLNLAFTVAKNPFLILGFFCYGLSILTWMAALSRTEVSFAYPFLSIGYVLVLIFGYYFFNETINIWKIFGIFFILVGVLMLAKGGNVS